MKKMLHITFKDLLLLFHDRAAFILMLAAPFALTLAMGAVSGSFSPSTPSGIESIPVMLVNQDEGPLGTIIAEALSSEATEGLIALTVTGDVSELRQEVENDRTAAGILISSGYSASVIPNPQTGKTGPTAPVEVYVNPARPVTSGIVQGLAAELISRLESGPIQGEIKVVSSSAAEQPEENQVNYMSYLAPGMAVFFLMYTVTQGGRGILAEKQMGTLTRLLSTPTTTVQILGGKVTSVFVSGFLQVAVLVLAAALLFRLDWGGPLEVGLLIAATAAAATGWGILLAAFARNTAQVSSIGTALMLTFGVLGGSFIPTSTFSPMMRLVSKITPNAWALDGFNTLANGGSLQDILLPLAGLLGIAAVLFGIAAAVSRPRWTDGFAK